MLTIGGVSPCRALCASLSVVLLTGTASARAEASKRVGPAQRLLVDEVVAAVATQTIMLSEVRAEARIQLLETHGPGAAALAPSRGLLAATLQRMIDQRLVLLEMDSLRTFELDKVEVEAALSRFRGRFGSLAVYEAFTRQQDLTDEEVGQVLARQIRYARYIDSKVKLAGAVRQGEAEELCAKELRRPPAPAELDACAHKLLLERYRRVTEEVLTELKKRVDVRILDPLADAAGAL